MAKNSKTFPPLSPAVLYILLALIEQDRHGYGIMQEVVRQSDGRCKLGPGTLYDNLERLTDEGLVKEMPCPKGDDDRRRRYYRLSDSGKDALRSELARLDKLLRRVRPTMRTLPGDTTS